MLSIRLAQSVLCQNYGGPAESYVGPSSYTTSTFGKDYPGFGDYGQMTNFKNPQITSSYSTFGTSSHDNNEFGSTTYVNYPPSSTDFQGHQGNYQQTSSYSSSQSWPGQSNYQSYSYPTFSPPTYGQETPISQHVEVTKPIVVPIYKKFPYAVSKRFPVAIPHPVLVPVPAYYPVNVEVSQPYAFPVIKEVRIPIEREVMYAVEKHVPVIIEKPVKYNVEKHYPVYVPKPYPVKVIELNFPYLGISFN